MSEERAKSSKTENQHIVMSEIDEATDSNLSMLFRSMMAYGSRNVVGVDLEWRVGVELEEKLKVVG